MPLKNRHISKFFLITGLIFYWAAVGYGFKQWDAKTSARVNLRNTPSLSGEILVTIPRGLQVKILQENGSWFRVDVSGEINSQGWVYASYLERILPQDLATEYPVETVIGQNISQAQKFVAPSADLLAKSRADAVKKKSRLMPLLAEYLNLNLKAQSTLPGERPNLRNEIYEPSQRPAFPAAEPIHEPSAQQPYHRVKKEASEITGKSLSAQVEPADAIATPASSPELNEDSAAEKKDFRPAESLQPAPAPSSLAVSLKKSIDYSDTKDIAAKQRVKVPFKIVLKLASILLYGLVIILLLKGI